MPEAFGSAEMLSCSPALLPLQDQLSSRLEYMMLKAISQLPSCFLGCPFSS